MLFINAPYKTIDGLSHENRPLADILEDHRTWLRGEGGQRASLRKANLIGANLRGFYLIGADLSGAILVNADLRETSLIGSKPTDSTAKSRRRKKLVRERIPLRDGSVIQLGGVLACVSNR